MTEPPRYECTLTPQDAPARAVQVQRLRAGLQTCQRHGQQVRLRFDAALAEVVEAFVRDESRCCDFFHFTIDQSADAEPLLHSLHMVFQPNSPHP